MRPSAVGGSCGTPGSETDHADEYYFATVRPFDVLRIWLAMT